MVFFSFSGIRVYDKPTSQPVKMLIGLGSQPHTQSSLTLVAPTSVDLDSAGSLVSKLMVIKGDQGAPAASVKSTMESAPEASLVTLRNYAVTGWTDVVEQTDEIG